MSAHDFGHLCRGRGAASAACPLQLGNFAIPAIVCAPLIWDADEP